MTCKTIVLSLVLLAFSMSTLAMGANSSTSAIEECCRRLDQQLPGRVLYPGMAYNESNIRWSTTAMLHPSCIVRPRNASDVSEAIVTLAGNDTNRSSCPFAIRSGGHTPTPRANDINNGITMDLRNINDTVLSPDHKSATIGTGSDWLNVYTTLDGTGVGVPGGRYGLVGVGGIALGGGLSFVSPKVGWVTDNVLAFEIVLASGEIITANRTHHPDLWHALKGGSSNFGIITRAEIMTFSSDGKFWGGSVVYPHSTTTTSQVLSALNEFTTNNHQDQNAASNTNFIYNATSGKKEIANTIVYSQDIANASIFGGIQSIQPQLANTAESTTIVELAANTASLPKGYRYGGATVTFKNPPEALVAAQSVTDSIYETVANVTDLVFTFVYEPIPRIYAEHSIERGGNIMGMESTVEDLILLLLIPRWTDAKYDSVMNAAFATWVDAMQEAQTRLGTHNRFTYLNYAAGSQDPLGSYGSANVEVMSKVAEKYDPDGVFQTLMPGGFKISESTTATAAADESVTLVANP